MSNTKEKFILIAGPCAIESEENTLRIAEILMNEIGDLIGENGIIDFYFKASFDKANRTSLSSYRGPGIDEGLRILKQVKENYNVKIVTDVHESYQVKKVATVCDMLQIPAFLCRQTDLLVAAAKTNRKINIKKAQFLAPWDMQNVVNKVRESGNNDIMLCERGTTFGYNQLVVDMSSFSEMKKNGCPVIFDATHSIQKPGSGGNCTLGNRQYIPYLAPAAIAAGADGLFVETHYDPEHALSDGPNMLDISKIRKLLNKCLEIRKIIQNYDE